MESLDNLISIKNNLPISRAPLPWGVCPRPKAVKANISPHLWYGSRTVCNGMFKGHPLPDGPFFLEHDRTSLCVIYWILVKLFKNEGKEKKTYD